MSAGQSAGTAAVDCTSYTSSCYPQGFRCAGSYSDAAGVMVPTWTGGAVSVTVGSDVDANDGSYINPTHTYTWSVLTFNAYNERCLMDNTCDNALYNVGWAATQQATQPSATPDQATFPGVGPKNQTTMQLRWTAPNPNGSPILEYRIVCTTSPMYAPPPRPQHQTRCLILLTFVFHTACLCAQVASASNSWNQSQVITTAGRSTATGPSTHR